MIAARAIKKLLIEKHRIAKAVEMEDMRRSRADTLAVLRRYLCFGLV
jgi:hypothetical protein